MNDDLRTEGVSAEQAVLGAMLIDPGCVPTVLSLLRPEDFENPVNQRLFFAYVELRKDNIPMDAVTAAERAGATEQERAYFAQLMEVTPTSANVKTYAAIVRQRAQKRELSAALEQAGRELQDGTAVCDVIPALEQALSEQAERSSGALLTPQQQMDRFLAHRETIDSGGRPYVRTGFPQLDKLLGGGMINAGFYIMAARPAIGKSSLALSIAEYAAEIAGPVVYISLEMDSEQITAKRISHLTRLPYQEVLNQSLPPEDYRKVAEAVGALSKSRLYINAGVTATVGQISAMARSRKDCCLVVIDHFSLIRTPRKQSRYEEYTNVSSDLKRLARGLKIPILCLAQLNRANEQRTDKRPQLSDLRDTGAAEQDADGVLLLHRDDYYDQSLQRKPWEPSVMDVRVAKNRHGAVGKDTLSFYMNTNTFRETYPG